MSGESTIKLTSTTTTGNLLTAPCANGFHLMWDIYDTSTSAAALDATISSLLLTFYTVAPNGSLIPFDGNNYSGTDRQISPSACGGHTLIKVVATGLTSVQELNVTLKNLF
jgi:hypothetical protein